MRSSLRVRRLLVLLFVLLATPVSFYAQVSQDTGVCCHAGHVGPVVMTVLDMNRSVDFYSRVLTFQKIGDRERSGREYDVLYGVPGAHVRTVDPNLIKHINDLQEQLVVERKKNWKLKGT